MRWSVLLILGSITACRAPEGLVFPAGEVSDADLQAMRDAGQPVFWPYGVKGGGHPEGHRGWDIEAPEGTAILAVGAGKIRRAGVCGSSGTPCSFGNFLVLALSGSGGVVGYHHVGPLEVEDGDEVLAGQTLASFARFGSEPALIHFDVAVGVNKQCPEPFMTQAAVTQAERWRSFTGPDPAHEDPIYLGTDGAYSAICFDL